MMLFALQGFWNFIPKAALGVLCAVLACFLVAGAVSNAGLKREVTARTAERDAAIANYARCQSNRITLETALASQNAAVVAMRDADAQQAADAAKAVSEARRATDDANRRVARIMAARPSGAACVADDADRLILETVR